jgi:putative multiple sugar transport system substrate-binding protein
MRKILIGFAAIAMILPLSACSDEKDSGGVHANAGARIGISLPTRVEQRWIADGKNMVEQFKAMGYDPDLQYAGNDVKHQIEQIQKMIDRQDKLLLVGAVNATSLTDVLAKAKAAGIPVIAYDRLILGTANVDYYATFDNHRVGQIQGSRIVTELGLDKGKGRAGPFRIELFAGSPEDNNSKVFFQGAMEILKPYLADEQLVVSSGESSFEEVATKGWDPAVAHARLTRLLDGQGRREPVRAVLAPNDGIARGLILALREAGYATRNRPLPIVTGQDAELSSIRSIIAKEQSQTVFKDTRELAKVAVQMGNAVLTDAEPMVNDTQQYDNGVKIVPTYLLQPIAVDLSNYMTLLVKGGYYTADQLQ